MHLITVIDRARGGRGEYDLELHAFTPYLVGANVGKAVTRLFTPPGSGQAQSDMRAASTPPTIDAAGLPGGAQSGISLTNVSGRAPWVGYEEIGAPAEANFSAVNYDPIAVSAERVADPERVYAERIYAPDFRPEELEAQGLQRDDLYKLGYDVDAARKRDVSADQAVMNLAGFDYDENGNVIQSQRQRDMQWDADDIRTSAERQLKDLLAGGAGSTARDIGGETLASSYGGVDPATLRRQAQEMRQLDEQMSRQLGAGWRTSTAGIQALNALQQRQQEEQFAEREQMIAGRAGLGTQYRNNFQQGANFFRNMASYNPYANSTNMLATRSGLAAQYQQPFSEQRARELAAAQFNSSQALDAGKFNSAQLLQNNQFNSAQGLQAGMFNEGQRYSSAALGAQQAFQQAQLAAQQRMNNYNTAVGQRTNLGQLLATQRNVDEGNRYGQLNNAMQLNQQNVGLTNQNMNAFGTGIGSLAATAYFLSDKRLKTDIRPIFKRRGVTFATYRWKDDPDGTPQFGVIAQDVARKFPEAVEEGEDGYLRVGADALRQALK